MKRWDWLINQVAPALEEAVQWESKRDPSSPMLKKFLVEAGLMDDIRKYADDLADKKYRDKLYLNDLEPDETG